MNIYNAQCIVLMFIVCPLRFCARLALCQCLSARKSEHYAIYM